MRKVYIDEMLQREPHIEGVHRGVHSGIIEVTPTADSILPGSSDQLSYSNDSSSNNAYRYYPSANLTYPQIEEGSNESPKRLSLDDRLELELGIKKPESSGPPNYSSGFGTYSYSTPLQLPPHASATAYHHHHPNVLQVFRDTITSPHKISLIFLVKKTLFEN